MRKNRLEGPSGRAASVAASLLGNGRITGIRVRGSVGAAAPHSLVGALPEAGERPDLLGALRELLAWAPFRDAFDGVLSEGQRETLAFVEKADALEALSRSREQEKALTAAAALYRAHVIDETRRFDGIGRHDRTAGTGEIWATDNLRDEAQIRSYAVLDEVLAVAAQRRRVLALEALPDFWAREAGGDLSARADTSAVRRAVATLDGARCYDAASWLDFLRRLFDAGDLAITVSDASAPGNPLVYVSQGFCQMTGYDARDAEGRNCRFLQGPATEPDALAVMRRASRARTECHVLVTNYRKNGQLFKNLLSFRPLFDATGTYKFVLGVQHEIMDQCILERRRLLRMLDDFVSSLPRRLPFRTSREPPRAEYKYEDAGAARAAAKRVVFTMTRLSILLHPERSWAEVCDAREYRDALRVAAASAACGSPAAAALLAGEPPAGERLKAKWVKALAGDFLPGLLHSAAAPGFVDAVRAHERDSGCVGWTCARDLGDGDPPATTVEARDFFLGCLRGAMEHASLACLACDCREPGMPICLGNDAFLRLAGVETESDCLEENCRFLQCEKSSPYLVEELSRACRSQRGALVRLRNEAEGRTFECLVALHPIHGRDREYEFQIGLCVDCEGPGEDVEARLTELEAFLALCPRSVECGTDADIARTLHAFEAPRRVETPWARAMDDPVPEDDPQRALRTRLAVESDGLEAIIQFTTLRWGLAPDETVAALLKQRGPCHDAFAAFCASRSRVARQLVRCWTLVDRILGGTSALAQGRLAYKAFSAWTENPLYLFSTIEIPVGSLGDPRYDWAPILKSLPDLQHRCIRILSRRVLPAFLRHGRGRQLVADLLGVGPLRSPGLPQTLDVDADLHTAAQHPRVGVPFLIIDRYEKSLGGLWYEMAYHTLRMGNWPSAAVFDTTNPDKVSTTWQSFVGMEYGAKARGDAVGKISAHAANSGAPAVLELDNGAGSLFCVPVIASKNATPKFWVLFLAPSNPEDRLDALREFGALLRYLPRTYDGRPVYDGGRRRSKGTTGMLPPRARSSASSLNSINEVGSVSSLPSAYAMPEAPESEPSTPVPQTSPAKSTSARSAAGASAFAPAVSSAAPLESPVAKSLRSDINRRLDRYMHKRARKHRNDMCRGIHLTEGAESESAFDSRSQSVTSGHMNLKALLSERAGLRKDGLLEKALELEAPIAALQERSRKARQARCARQLEAAKVRVSAQHENRIRSLESVHRQERMAHDREVDLARAVLQREHEKQSCSFVEEMIDKAAGTGLAGAGGQPAYLDRRQQFNIRARTKAPEFVRQLKLAKHLRKKKRFAEADECERAARQLDLETAKQHCEGIKKVATGRRLENLVVQLENATGAHERRHTSRLLSMERRHARALTNLQSLLHVDLAKLDKQFARLLSSNYDADFNEQETVQKKDIASPRPPSAPARMSRRSSSFSITHATHGKSWGSARTTRKGSLFASAT